MRVNNQVRRRAGLFPAFTALAPVALAALFIFAANALQAQDGTGQPARAVRLSYVDGKVSIFQDNKLVTDQAVANTPLFEGMTLTSGEDGRAEVQFEDGSVARISPDSSLTLSVLRGQGASAQTEMDVAGGLAYFELQGTGQSGQMSVHFADNTVTAGGFTILRVNDDQPPGELAVFSGNAHVERASGAAFDIHSGESAVLSATDPGGYSIAESIAPDSWDAWNSDRDQALNAEAAAESSAPADLNNGQDNNPAWGDLDANGSWYNVPDQGYVWSPYDAANPGFDPYGNGSWIWSPGFGYTWASAYSWGYLPYQCGAWNYYDGFGWGWAPGFGGCTPWWGVGFYSGPVIGFAPGWYRRIHRPPTGPIHPGHPIPVIAVHRHPQVFTAGLPRRNANIPVSIHGYTVTAMRTMPTRSTYPRASSSRASFGFRSGYGMPAQSGLASPDRARSDYVPARPAYTRSIPSSGFEGNSAGGYQRPYTLAPQRTYAPQTGAAPVRHYSPPAPQRFTPSPGYRSGGWDRSGGGGGHSAGGGHR